jgi:hypothetical protein
MTKKRRRDDRPAETPAETPLEQPLESSDDDLRFAPPVPPIEESLVEPVLDSVVEETTAFSDSIEGPPMEEPVDQALDLLELPEMAALAAPEALAEPPIQPIQDVVERAMMHDAVVPTTVTDGLDLEAALAAVSTLDDMVAEQEAAEQARIAREEALVEARAEAEARLQNPELFFPVPTLLTLQRGQLQSLVPALALILLGAWLTFSLTTTNRLPDTPILLGAVGLAIALTLLSRWLSSGRWARGALFAGITLLLLVGVAAVLVLQPTGFDLQRGWPLLLAAPGLGMILAGLLARPLERGLFYAGLVLVMMAVAGLVPQLGVLSGSLLAIISSAWPVVAGVGLIFLLLPFVFRARRS